ncbi:hypothetical protein PSEUBRA_000655 [Kalmanozyma brasiliensis GHG001]|uniref:uncharacterized protein n=1 Tax=Kalmanozyma brasiliensis (strain GHG001) TaxID=1365824 RepID=UPI002868239F|nr:uncharacterized protein PSEUBRA_000655 [Kalmanozyma brasiliensis GHG001]KAF6766830.1 hypothetical protein PSEUBRA_000655 [Kalmanozyma brasiliensis GHG001]
MYANTRSTNAQAGPSSQAASSHRKSSRSIPAEDLSLQHKPSLATTLSTSSASSDSQPANPFQASWTKGQPTQSAAYSDSFESSKTRSRPQPRRTPVYIRIVPKDVWLRIHVEPTQTIASIKDAALIKAGMPEHDSSLSYRFYQDALTASASAKMAPVSSHDKVVKYRTYAHPKSFSCPPPDLSDVTAAIAASVAGNRERSNTLHADSNGKATSSVIPPMPLPAVDSAFSTDETQPLLFDESASPRSRTFPPPLPHNLEGSSSASDDAYLALPPHSDLAASPASTLSDLPPTTASDTSVSDSSEAINELGVQLGASLITGNRDAKAEEDEARRRLSQWSARRESESLATHAEHGGLREDVLDEESSRRERLQTDSFNSTPTIASSSTFGSDFAFSPSMPPSSSNMDAGRNALRATIATPPRRPARLNPGLLGAPASASIYTQPGASESFNSLASFDSPSSVPLLTTAEDDAGVMRWGTQAEGTPSSDPFSPSPSVPSTSGSGVSPLSSPTLPSAPLDLAWPESVSSPARPRSRTVTAADILKQRKDNHEETPPLPETVSSPSRQSSLPRFPSRRLVAESSQCREVPQVDLLDMLRGSPRLTNDDDEEGFSTVKPRNVRAQAGMAPLRKKASDVFSSDSDAVASPPSSMAASVESRGQYIAGIRRDEISRGPGDTTHPLSGKFAVLSSANGCELQDWKTVAAYRIRPYELLELQWTVPTERVYIPPISLRETIRSSSAAPSDQGMFKSTWRDAADAGPDADAPCLEPYFEGWVYVLRGGAMAGKSAKSSKGSSSTGKWRLHWMMVKGWRADLYRKRPRAGEAVLPVAEQVRSLRSIEWVAMDTNHPIPPHPALPALDTMPPTSVTVAFSPKGAASQNEGSTLTLRCISQFDHQAVSMVLLRAWFRCSVTQSSLSAGVDDWRRKAVFRAIVAGRGGTVAAGQAGRGGRGGRNAKARTRLRPTGWPKEWEDADQWSSDSEGEDVAPPAELEHLLWLQRQQARRDTVTQATAGINTQSRKEREEEREKVTPGGLYAALLGRTTSASTNAATSTKGPGSDNMSPFNTDSSPFHLHGSRGGKHLAHSPSLPHMEPGLMAGSNRALHFRSGSLPRSPAEPAMDAARSRSSSRSRSLTTISSPDLPSPKVPCRGRLTPSYSSSGSRNGSRDASPMPSLPSSGSSSRKGSGASGLSSRKGSGSGSAGKDPFTAPALAPGYVDAPPPPNVLLLQKFKASQKGKEESS